MGPVTAQKQIWKVFVEKTIVEQQNNKQNYRFPKRSISERNYLN